MAGIIALPRSWGKQKPPIGTPLVRGPLTQGLEIAWLANEGGGGTLYDASGHGRAATVQSATTRTFGASGPVLSVPGSSASTNGASANITGLGNPSTSAVTMMGRVRPSSTGSTMGILSLRPVADGNSAHVLDMRSGNWAVEGFGGGGAGLTGSAAVANAWVTLAVTTTAAQASVLYVDGRAVASGSNTLQSFTPGVFHFGRFGSDFDPFTGLLDWALLSSRALSGAEVLSLTLDPYALFAPPQSRRGVLPAAAAGPPVAEVVIRSQAVNRAATF